MSDAPRAPVMIMAGGTGGHIFPGLAVAEALRARGETVLWLGTDGGMETRLVPARGFAIETLAVKGLRGKGIAGLLKAPLTVGKAVLKARSLMMAHRPAAVISFGGYAAGPGGVAAWLLGHPLLVHEQNCAPGLTNRLLARLADKVLTGFPNSFGKVPNTIVGNPVRPEISALPPPAQRRHDGEALRVLVLGGSQGARALNAVLPAVFAGIPRRLDIRHQCGEKLLDETRQAYAAVGVDASLEPFIQDMAAAYGWADVVIGRAGALTVAEICAAGVAALLVPLPTAVDDHQAKNAEFLKQHGGGLWFRQGPDLSQRLKDALTMLASDSDKRLAMANAARAAAFPHAAEDVAELVLREVRA